MVKINLSNIRYALTSLGVGTEHIDIAVEELNAVLAELDDVEVKGRQNVDTLLGCMIGLDAIIGGESNS